MGYIILVETHYQELRESLGSCHEELVALKDAATTLLTILSDLHYRDGILSIEAAFETFMDIGDNSGNC